MPNMKDSHEFRRRLYATMMSSIVLYGTFIWCESLDSSRQTRQIFLRLGRLISLRTIAGYRTVSHDAAMLLTSGLYLDTVILDTVAFGQVRKYAKYVYLDTVHLNTVRLDTERRAPFTWTLFICPPFVLTPFICPPFV
ncbi:hypothetical protein ACFW04_013149 [Cataglyphis niger]